MTWQALQNFCARLQKSKAGLDKHLNDTFFKAQWWFVYLFEFYGKSTFVGYSTSNQFLYEQFFFKFSLAQVHLIVKNISISTYSV